ncbi:hypothetical protein CDAR_403921 [Caerostris darwini]|uniref:Uncharacterized protein n=1 Tax=Caerostris darwini TaxID=1538125 RepID=A0AAV4SR62_9ARAC|nr:hypothetical protein CDAR_403921 [Caerostris darwini]
MHQCQDSGCSGKDIRHLLSSGRKVVFRCTERHTLFEAAIRRQDNHPDLFEVSVCASYCGANLSTRNGIQVASLSEEIEDHVPQTKVMKVVASAE